ncbi:phosphatase PAP2 family protein [Sedimenticola selenatireducens]|uniref:phosphatase PAP2 family protein n=1 Tax=Sedimenticola selenatireducens TaxID=191960 RepID=UPI0004BAB310|nr:phosphatase PAP2 family protein [Sedimenticola selenatireducens]
MNDTMNAGWHKTPLILANLLALLLMLSWLVEPTRGLWQALDEQLFWAMNRSLDWSEGWRRLWAVANNRAFDLVAAVAMLLLFAHQALLRDRKRLQHYIAVGLMMFITLLLMLAISKELPIERPSATAQFPEALRLTQLVPDIPTKDYSSDSFPGDHGLVLLLCAGFAVAYLPRIHGLLALLFMVIFTMPRLMSGAHWVTDEIVGALSLGLITLSWLFATPLHRRLLGWFERQISRLFTRLGFS